MVRPTRQDIKATANYYGKQFLARRWQGITPTGSNIAVLYRHPLATGFSIQTNRDLATNWLPAGHLIFTNEPNQCTPVTT